MRELGAIDILVNNAGTIRRAPAVEFSDEDWDAVMDVNLSAVFRLCRAAGRQMLARGRGKIMNIASLLSFQGGITVPAYAASKGGVAQLTKALANEWAGKGVNVNAIAPGYIHTDNTAALAANPDAQPPDPRAHPGRRAGASPPISAAPPCSSRRAPATTSAATCWWSTAAGWDGDAHDDATAKLTVKAAPDCRFDLVSLGEVMLRLDPGEGRIHTTRAFSAWEGGGEYNVARGLRRCFGLRTAHVTALADNPVGRLVEDLMLQGGVDLSYLRWKEYDGVGRSVRNGLNFTERGFGPRGGVGCSDRGHTAVSQLQPRRRRLEAAVRRRRQGARWLHTGGVFCALSEGTPAVARAAMEEAHEHGTCVSYDLNYRDSLWRSVGGKVQARAVNRSLMPFVDVLFGNEEDFSAALGFELEDVDPNFKSLPTAAFRAMIDDVVAAFPNIKTVATTLRTSRSASVNGWGAICWHEGQFYEVAAARRRDPGPRRRRRFVRLGLHLRPAGRQGSAVGARVRRRARRAGDVDARRHDDGDVRRGDARDEGLGNQDRSMSRRRRDLPPRRRRRHRPGRARRRRRSWRCAPPRRCWRAGSRSSRSR